MNKIIIHTKEHLRFIDREDIVFCNSVNSYTDIYLSGGGKILIPKSLTKFSKELGAAMFARVSQSYLVNKNYIHSIHKKKRHIELTNQAKIQFTITIKELLSLVTGNTLSYDEFSTSYESFSQD